jgi:hypothetical protein
MSYRRPVTEQRRGAGAVSTENRPEQLLSELAALVGTARCRSPNFRLERTPCVVRLSMTDAEYATFNRLLDEATQICRKTETKGKETT